MAIGYTTNHTILDSLSLVSAASEQLSFLGIMPPLQQKIISLTTAIIMNDTVAFTYHFVIWGIFLLMMISRLGSAANDRKHDISNLRES